ncbi:cupin domain-containing protein [Pararhodonellum marinum]|uniref:cupin domain-containing protein n=1 Tax=Pararhodonellum marinum TaxID=2755358 RepID=UPI00188F9975|nr:cupin domain-containing protein [Pararhodonellum marinum]
MEIYHNPATGDVMKIIQSSKDRKDGKLIIEVTIKAFADWAKVYHYHPTQTETFKVIQGHLSMRVDGRQLTLNPGDRKLIVPPKMGHCFWNETDKPVTFEAEIYPAGSIENALIATYNLGLMGKMNEKNVPKSLADKLLLFEMVDSVPVGIPEWLLKTLIKTLMIVPMLQGRKRGLPEYINLTQP